MLKRALALALAEVGCRGLVAGADLMTLDLGPGTPLGFPLSKTRMFGCGSFQSLNRIERVLLKNMYISPNNIRYTNIIDIYI